MAKYKKSRVQKPTPLCHVSPKKVFIIGGTVEIYGGNQAAVLKRSRQFDLIVQASDLSFVQKGVTEIPLMSMNDEARKLMPSPLMQTVPPTPHIKLDWPDYQVPSVSMDWWDDFLEWLLTDDAPRRVAMACQGGHGRTGTMLAILAGLGGMTSGDPVAFIRAAYCQNAVESREQLDYIAEVTGLEVHARPSEGVFQGDPETYGSDSSYLPSWATLQDDPEEPKPETH